MYLGLKKCHLVIHIGIIFSVLFFYSTLSICICLWVSKVYTRVRIYSCQDPLDISIWLTCHLLCSRSFRLQGYLKQPICRLCLFSFFLFLLANKTVLSGSLCFRGAGGVCLDWVHLCIAVVPQCHSFYAPRWPPQPSTPGYPLVSSNHLVNLLVTSSYGHHHVLL